MRKATLILSAGLAMVAALVVFPGWNAPRPLLTQLPVRTLLPNARPLVWLDERVMLAGVDNKIVKLDSRDATILNVVSEPFYPAVGYECFSREGGRFAVTMPEKSRGSVSYEDMIYRWVRDWSQPAQFEELKTCEAWNTNPHDCTAVNYQKVKGEEQAAPQLLKAAHGRTRVFSRRAGSEDRDEWAVTIEKDGHVKNVALGQPPFFFGHVMRSSFDESSGLYFWYLSTELFDLNNAHLPLKGWWVTPEGTVTDTVILPNGPWIRPFSTLYTLRFFSCGPSCYSHMDMWAGQRRIYIAVWGEAIDARVRGVYRLGADGLAWEKIVAGTLDNGLILSPSGCQIGYATGGRLQIMTVCDRS